MFIVFLPRCDVPCACILYDKKERLFLSYRSRKDVDSTQIKRHNAEVESVVETLSNMTDPFDDDLEDLVNIANGEIATASMSNDLLKSHKIEEKFKEFVCMRNMLLQCTATSGSEAPTQMFLF